MPLFFSNARAFHGHDGGRPPSLDLDFPSELARASTARSEEVELSDVVRAIGRDASVTTQASPYDQSAGFPATSLFRDDQSRRGREPGKIPGRSGIAGDF